MGIFPVAAKRPVFKERCMECVPSAQVWKGFSLLHSSILQGLYTHIAEGFSMITWPFTRLVQCRSWGTAGLLHCTPQGQSWSADSGQLALVKGKGQSRSGIWWARPGQMDRIIWITNMLLYFHLIPFLELVYLALIAHCVVCWVRRHGSGVGLESHIRWNNNDGRFPNLQRD